jgi:hypothetical protein
MFLGMFDDALSTAVGCIESDGRKPQKKRQLG